jgi:rubrerythrin
MDTPTTSQIDKKDHDAGHQRHDGADTPEPQSNKRPDACCLACGFRLKGGANVELCPECGSKNWHKMQL